MPKLPPEFGWDAQAQLRARHAQGPRHHRMGAERALEIRQHVVAVVGSAIFGHHHVAFHRREGIARIVDGERDAGVGLLERTLGLAVGELADRDLVGLGVGMQERRRFFARGLRVDHRRERLVVDGNQLGRVLGQIAALGHHQRHRLAHIAHVLDRERPLVDLGLERDQERVAELAHVLAGDHRPDAVLCQRLSRVDADNLGVRVRRANDVGVQRPGRHRQVVGVAPAPRQQRGVFLPQHRSAEELGHCSPLVGNRSSACRPDGAKRHPGLVSRFRSSPTFAAPSDANFGIKGTLATL